MTSKSLYFKLLWEDLKRRSWAIALAVIAFFFALPINLALTMENAQADNFYRYNDYVSLDAMHWSSEAAKAARILELKTGIVLSGGEFGNGFLAFLMIVTAVVMGVSSFAYLHNRRKVDFYHSLPIRREMMYLVQYTGGVLIIAGIYLLNLIFYVGVSCTYGVPVGNVLGGLLAGWLLNLLYFLLLYGVTVAAVMLTGQLLVGLLAVGVLFFFLPVLVLVLESYCEIFFETMPVQWQWEEGWLMDTLKWISPFTAYLFALSWGMKELGNHIPALIVTFFAVLALGIFGMALYRLRPLESAGRAMAFRRTRTPIRFIMVWGYGIMGALFFWMIQSRPYWAVFGAVMGALISHCVIEVIYHFDFKKLFAHWPQMILAVALSIALFFSFRFDWWGYDSYLPAEEKVESASVSMDLDQNWLSGRKIETAPDGSQSVSWEDSDEYRMENMYITDLQPVLTLAQEGIRQEKAAREERFDQWKQSGSSPADERQNLVWSSFQVSYRLNNGRTVSRRYNFGMDENMMEAYSQLYEQPAYKEGLYSILGQSAENLAWASYEESGAVYGGMTDRKSLSQLLAAYQADLMDLTVETRQKENPVGRLMFADQEQKKFLDEHSVQAGRNAYSSDTYTPYDVCQGWPVYPSFDRTLSFLRDQDIAAGYGLNSEDVDSISVDFYWNEEKTLEELQAVNSRFETIDRMVFDDPEEIALLLSAFSEDEMYNYNGLCDVRGDFTLYVRTKKGDGVSGSLQMNRITPEIEELFVGTGLFEE